MLITAYCNWMTLAGYRPSTITARRCCLLAFEQSAAPHHLHDVGRRQVEAYLSRPLSPESRRAYRSHLKAFYSWAIDQEYLRDDPTAKVPPIRVPRAQPRPMAAADLTVALEQAAPRMRAWLLLMALAGLRCLEVAALRPSDLLCSEAGTLLYLREVKGGGTGSVPAHPATLEALQLLPIRSGKWWDCSARHVSVTTAAYLRGVGVTGTAHALRHTAATAWYRASGHDLLVTAQLMRHASVQNTQRYAALDPLRSSEVVQLVKGPVRAVDRVGA